MNILMILLMVVLGVAAAWLLRLPKTEAPWAQQAGIICLVAVVILAIARMFMSGGKPTTKDVFNWLERHQEVCGEVVGTTLAERHPGARVVVLTPPRQGSGQQQALIKSLQNTMEKGGLTVTLQPLEISEADKAQFTQFDQAGMTAEMKEEMISAMLMDTPKWFGVKDIRKSLADLKDRADLLVCKFDHPLSLGGAKLPQKGSGPALVVINADSRNVQPLLENTVLDTVVTYRSNPEVWKPGAKPPRNKQDAFDQRYELITADSL